MTQTSKILPHVSQHPYIEEAPEIVAEHLAASGIVEAWGEPQPFQVDILDNGKAQLVWGVDGVKASCRVWFLPQVGPDETVLYEGPWGAMIASGEGVSYQSTNDLALVLRDVVGEVAHQQQLAREAAARAAEEARLLAEAEAQREAERQAAAQVAAEEAQRHAAEADRAERARQKKEAALNALEEDPT